MSFVRFDAEVTALGGAVLDGHADRRCLEERFISLEACSTVECGLIVQGAADETDALRQIVLGCP